MRGRFGLRSGRRWISCQGGFAGHRDAGVPEGKAADVVFPGCERFVLGVYPHTGPARGLKYANGTAFEDMHDDEPLASLSGQFKGSQLLSPRWTRRLSSSRVGLYGGRKGILLKATNKI